MVCDIALYLLLSPVFLLGFGKEIGLSTMLLVHTNADLSGCFKLLQMKEQSVSTIIFVLLLSACF